MFKFFKRLLGGITISQPDKEPLALQAEIQRMRLALDEAQAKIARLEGELERQQRNEEKNREAAIQARLTPVFSDLAGPAAQFLLQLDLVEKPEHALQARDTLAVARGILRALQNHGLEISDPVGAVMPFDPARNEPLSSMDSLKPGQPVQVRLPGLSFRGQQLRKAGVTPQEE